MIELDLSGVQQNEYKYFDVGINKCYIDSVKKTTSQSGNPMLEVHLKRKDGASLTDRLVLTPSAMWRVQVFLKACQLPHKGKVSIDEKDINSRHLQVECFAEAYKKQDGTDGTVIKVKKYIADPDFNYAALEQAMKEQPEQTVSSDDIPL